MEIIKNYINFSEDYTNGSLILLISTILGLGMIVGRFGEGSIVSGYIITIFAFLVIDFLLYYTLRH